MSTGIQPSPSEGIYHEEERTPPPTAKVEEYLRTQVSAEDWSSIDVRLVLEPCRILRKNHPTVSGLSLREDTTPSLTPRTVVLLQQHQQHNHQHRDGSETSMETDAGSPHRAALLILRKTVKDDFLLERVLAVDSQFSLRAEAETATLRLRYTLGSGRRSEVILLLEHNRGQVESLSHHLSQVTASDDTQWLQAFYRLSEQNSRPTRTTRDSAGSLASTSTPEPALTSLEQLADIHIHSSTSRTSSPSRSSHSTSTSPSRFAVTTSSNTRLNGNLAASENPLLLYQLQPTSSSVSSTSATNISPTATLDSFPSETTNHNSTAVSTMKDADAIRAIKEKWIATQLESRQAEFTQDKPLTYFVGTWNVNGKLVSESLQPWLSHASTTSMNADVVVLGFQEVDLSAEAFLTNASTREEYWGAMIEEGLGDHAVKYQKLVSKQLVGMLLFVYVRNELKPFISGISTDSAGCGIMGTMGNKGGVAVRFWIYDSWICFVNSHLAADSKEVGRRNQDYTEIGRRIRFERSTGKHSATIWENDHLVWLGDLNYRIGLPQDEVKGMLDKGDLDGVLHHDQLHHEREAQRAFAQFDEGRITFPPSYKYDPGTSTFDTSEKKRTPSWCDRILWRRNDPIQCLRYQCHMELVTSDHKPVSCTLQATAKQIRKEKQAEVIQSILRLLDRYENECMPDATINRNQITFDNVEYLKPVTETIILENTGQVVAQFRFVPKLEEKTYCKSWLWVNPPMSMLLPGEKMEIHFTVLVDNTNVTALNTGAERLEDILILHLENGKDVFISVNGQFRPTCFGMSLEHLVRLPDPVRTSASLIETYRMKPDELKPALSVPKELWRMVDYLFRNGLETENLFLCSGDGPVMESIRRCLDTGKKFMTDAQLKGITSGGESLATSPVKTSASASAPSSTVSSTTVSPVKSDAAPPQPPPPQDGGEDAEFAIDKKSQYIHAMAESIVRFLDALPESVIPSTSQHYQKCIDAYQSFALAEQAIDSLPRTHYNTFVYVVSFLREVIQKAGGEENRQETRERLAMVFAAVLLRSPTKARSEKLTDILMRKKVSFLLHFLAS